MVSAPCYQVEVVVDNLSDQGCLFLLLRLGRARVKVHLAPLWVLVLMTITIERANMFQ